MQLILPLQPVLLACIFLARTQSPGIQLTKGMAAMLVYTTKECNYNSIVIVHQHGGYDVTCKPRMRMYTLDQK